MQATPTTRPRVGASQHVRTSSSRNESNQTLGQQLVCHNGVIIGIQTDNNTQEDILTVPNNNDKSNQSDLITQKNKQIALLQQELAEGKLGCRCSFA